MKSSSRTLYIFGAVIGALVILTVALVLALGSPSEEPLAEGTPEGTVQRFLLALKDMDYLAAESYLAASEDDERNGDLLKNRLSSSNEDSGWKAVLGDTAINGDEATVEVRVDTFRPRGLFESSVNTQKVTFFLEKQDDAWKIVSPVNIWWIY